MIVGEVVEKVSSRPLAQIRNTQIGGFPKLDKKRQTNRPDLQARKGNELKPLPEFGLTPNLEDELDQSTIDSNSTKVLSMTQEEIQDALQEIGAVLSAKNIEFLRKRAPVESVEESSEPDIQSTHTFDIQQHLKNGMELFDLEGCRLFNEQDLVESILAIWKNVDGNTLNDVNQTKDLAIYLVHNLENLNHLRLFKSESADSAQIFNGYDNVMTVRIFEVPRL